MVAPGDAAGTAMPPAGVGEGTVRKQPGVLPQNLHPRAGNGLWCEHSGRGEGWGSCRAWAPCSESVGLFDVGFPHPSGSSGLQILGEITPNHSPRSLWYQLVAVLLLGTTGKDLEALMQLVPQKCKTAVLINWNSP